MRRRGEGADLTSRSLRCRVFRRESTRRLCSCSSDSPAPLPPPSPPDAPPLLPRCLPSTPPLIHLHNVQILPHLHYHDLCEGSMQFEREGGREALGVTVLIPNRCNIALFKHTGRKQFKYVIEGAWLMADTSATIACTIKWKLLHEICGDIVPSGFWTGFTHLALTTSEAPCSPKPPFLPVSVFVARTNLLARYSSLAISTWINTTSSIYTACRFGLYTTSESFENQV